MREAAGIATTTVAMSTNVNGAAQNLAMLIVGRILLGCGVGFANQVRYIISLSRVTLFRLCNAW